MLQLNEWSKEGRTIKSINSNFIHFKQKQICYLQLHTDTISKMETHQAISYLYLNGLK